MSILQTLYILFKTEGTSEVKKGQEDVEKSTKELEKSLKKTDSTSSELSASFGLLGNKLLGLVSAYQAAHFLFSGFKNAINYEQDLNLASRALRVNVSELDAWGNAVQQVGGTSEAFQASLGSLSEKFRLTGEDTLKILPQLADSFQKFGRNYSLQYGRTVLGLDTGTILLLQKGSVELAKILALQKKLGVVTPEQAEKAGKFAISWQNATHALRTNFMDAAKDIVPELTKIFDKFTELSNLFHESPGAMKEVFNDLKIAIEGVGIAIGVLTLKSLIYDGVLKKLILRTALSKAGLIGLAAAAGLWAYEDVQKAKKGEKHTVVGDFIVKAQEAIGRRYRVAEKKFERDEELDYQKKNNISGLKEWIDLVDDHPFTSQTSNSLMNNYAGNSSSNSTNRNISINIGDVTIQTQAQDANAVSIDFQKFLTDHLKQAINNFDDGLRI